MREKRKLIFSEKTSDLFTFKQSIDLHHVDTPIIKNLVETLESKSFIGMISKFTGFGLSGKVDFFASIYTKGDYLLCHDDCLSTRKIAFIYYLTSLDWTISDGGYLQLFENSLEPPDQNFKNIKPTFNSLAFFEVSRKSFHRVQEVSGDRIRLSITGWYHSSEKQDIPKPIFDSKNYFSKTIKFEENDFFKLCLNPFYFDQNAKLQIRSQFLENGNIELKNFLREEAVLEFLEYDFKSRDWLYRGPFTYRNFYTKKPKQTKKSKILKLFGSKEFVNFLDFVTKDDITECNAVINKFSKGSYNLLNDFSNGFQKRTETIFNIFSKSSQKKISKLDKNTGGTIHYFKESEEQFSIDPE
ncbi:Prolyl 3-hydroxylase ogfod1, partial [Bonamia ostreae]